MKSDFSREDWLAIFEKAASLEGEAGKEACWRMVQLLGLDAAYYPDIQIALEQGVWRKAENPPGIRQDCRASRGGPQASASKFA